jgi:hypothetical protein
VRYSASSPISTNNCIRFGNLVWRHLAAEVFRTQGEQLHKRRRRKVGLHELLGAREGERGLQFTVDIGEKQRAARQGPVVKSGEPGDRLVVLAGCEPQRDAGGWAWCAACDDARAQASSE